MSRLSSFLEAGLSHGALFFSFEYIQVYHRLWVTPHHWTWFKSWISFRQFPTWHQTSNNSYPNQNWESFSKRFSILVFVPRSVIYLYLSIHWYRPPDMDVRRSLPRNPGGLLQSKVLVTNLVWDSRTAILNFQVQGWGELTGEDNTCIDALTHIRIPHTSPSTSIITLFALLS